MKSGAAKRKLQVEVASSKGSDSSSVCPEQIMPSSIASIDAKIAELLGVGIHAIELNGMAFHPITQDLYISVPRIGSSASQPAVIMVTHNHQVSIVDLDSFEFLIQALLAFPGVDTTLRPRGAGGSGPLPRDIAKGEIPLRTLAIMDVEFYEDELFVAGVAHDNFLSSLRRMPYCRPSARRSKSLLRCAPVQIHAFGPRTPHASERQTR